MTAAAGYRLSPLEAALALTWILEREHARLCVVDARLVVDLDAVSFPVGECDRADLLTIIAGLEAELIAVVQYEQRRTVH